MPCMKCSNGKYKYGEHGKCVYDTLAACKRAAAAIHIGDKQIDPYPDWSTPCSSTSEDCTDEWNAQFK
jgi:hypothetical protein